MNANRTERYRIALRDIPPSGGGGCNAALLGVANLGRWAGVNRDRVAQDLGVHVHGTRKVTDGEIWDAVNRAFDSLPASTQTTTPRPALDGAKLLNAIVKRGADFHEAELWEASPVRIDWPPERDGIEVLRRLYAPEERLFIGARHDASVEHVRSVSEWIVRFERGISIPEHIIPNPLTGAQGKTKDGKTSYRADSCVKRFMFAVIEFDAMPRQQQIQFWGGVKLPAVALVDSGGKSIHAWIRIDAPNAAEWAKRDCRACLATFEAKKKQRQRILYLNPVGRPILP
jgi:hypothetical protein